MFDAQKAKDDDGYSVKLDDDNEKEASASVVDSSNVAKEDTCLEMEKAAMMAIKEQSIELEQLEACGTKPRSGMKKVLDAFPFLRTFGVLDSKSSSETPMTKVTTKPEILDNDPPSYSEATRENCVGKEGLKFCEQGLFFSENFEITSLFTCYCTTDLDFIPS